VTQELFLPLLDAHGDIVSIRTGVNIAATYIRISAVIVKARFITSLPSS
jgi:hypothetical protein